MPVEGLNIRFCFYSWQTLLVQVQNHGCQNSTTVKYLNENTHFSKPRVPWAASRPKIHFLSPTASFLKINLPINFRNFFWVKRFVLVFLRVNIWKHFLDKLFWIKNFIFIFNSINNNMSDMNPLWTNNIPILVWLSCKVLVLSSFPLFKKEIFKFFIINISFFLLFCLAMINRAIQYQWGPLGFWIQGGS